MSQSEYTQIYCTLSDLKPFGSSLNSSWSSNEVSCRPFRMHSELYEGFLAFGRASCS
jgi:hypothetical protein